ARRRSRARARCAADGPSAARALRRVPHPCDRRVRLSRRRATRRSVGNPVPARSLVHRRPGPRSWGAAVVSRRPHRGRRRRRAGRAAGRDGRLARANGAGRGVSPRPLAGSRLRRVLALVPWIAEHPGAALEEIAARFGVSEAELEHDLELLPLCGLPPYTPDRLIEVEIVDGHVWIRFAEYFDRPLRFSAEEGLALLTAGRALLAVPGSDERGALATALDKLAGALGATEGLSVEVGEPPHLEALRRAADTRERVEIDYYSFGRNATTSRKIDPRSVFHAFGHWYAAAYCHQAQDDRLFRLDRI